MEFTKYKRGSVWFYKDSISKNDLQNYKTNVESGGRPCIIISNDTFNSYSPIVNVFMLSGSIKPNKAHITIDIIGNNNIYSNNKFNMKCKTDILCEQIKTVDINDLTEYLGMVSSDVMDKIDEKISFQLDIQKSSRIVTNKLKAFIDKYIEIKSKNLNTITASDIMEELKENLNKLIEDKVNENNISQNISKKEIIIDVPIENVVKLNKNSKRNKGKWTKEDKDCIVNNYYNNREMLLKKYNKTSTELSKLYFYLKNKEF